MNDAVHQITAAVNHAVDEVYEPDPFVPEDTMKEILRHRLLRAVAAELGLSDLTEFLKSLITIKTFESPIVGPTFDDAEVAAEDMLSQAQAFYDEFRQPE